MKDTMKKKRKEEPQTGINERKKPKKIMMEGKIG